MNWLLVIVFGLVAILGGYEFYALIRDIKNRRKNKSAVDDGLKGVQE